MLRLIPMTAFALQALGLACTACAQSFSDLESTLWDHPSLQAMEFQARASQEMATAESALPDPVLSAGINNFPFADPSFSTFLPTNKALGIRQQFPSQAGRRARAGGALAAAARSQKLREQRYAQLRAELIVALHDQTRIARQRELAELTQGQYDRLLQVAESELDAGRPGLSRLADIASQRAEVSRTLAELTGQSAQIEARLIDLVGTASTVAPPALTAQPWSGEMDQFHAAQVAKAWVSVGDRDVEAAEAAWKPEWGLELTYQQREAGRDFAGDDWLSAKVTVTVPLWAERSQAPRLRSAKARREAADANYQAAARAAAAQYAAYQALAQTAAESKAVFEQKIQAITAQTEAQLTVYESGQADYAPIIDGQIAILKLRSEIAAEQARLATAIAHMNALLVTL